MRVIGGRLKSRVLKSVPGMHTRPTPDRLRESLFNILAPKTDGTVFVDVYAGTGSVGIEALSRGARRAIFLERGKAAVGILRQNLESLGLSSQSEVVSGKAAQLLSRYVSQADIVFLDPPYEEEREYRTCMDVLSQSPPPLVIVQHASRFELNGEWKGLERWRVVKQGDNSLTFFVRNLFEL